MMKKKKIISVVGARPNIIKMAPIHKKLYSIHKYNHKIVHTGQHYDYKMSEIFFKEFNLPFPDYNLEVGSGTANYQIGEMLKRIEKVYLEEQPDLVLVYGDTNSTLAGALTANKCGIPLAHIEAGLRSFDRNMPEEINRTLTDHLSDYLFAPTPTAVDNLGRENVVGKIYNTGDISVEILKKAKRTRSAIIRKLKLRRHRYLLLTLHRVENTNSPIILKRLAELISELGHTTIVFPIHPRTEKILTDLELMDFLKSVPHLRLISPLGYGDFISLIMNSGKVLTDSGGVQKEAYLLRTPCITLRSTTEWVETVKDGWNKLEEISSKRLIDLVKKPENRNRSQNQIFGIGRTSRYITQIIGNIIHTRT